MITANRQDRYITRAQTTGISQDTVRLADAVREVLENRISPQQSRFSSVIDSWQQLVPAELGQHCRVVDLVAGVLKVMVDSAPYMYELQLCRCELLNELKRQCPHARVKRIELTVG